MNPKNEVHRSPNICQEGGLRKRGIHKESSRDEPLVSVITVVLNGEQHLEETIRSVIGQSYKNIEYIIIDGASQDRTLEIIKGYDTSIDYWISVSDGGIYEAMNRGIELAQGELINLMNADDYFSPNAVEKAVSKYFEKKRPCIIYGDYFLIDEVLGYKVEAKSNMNYWLGMTVSHQTMFIHREVYASLGEYDAHYRLAADYDFLMRAVKNKVEFVHTGHTIAMRRLNGKGGKKYFLSKKETNSINKEYFGGDVTQRFLFFANIAVDTAKLGIIRGLHFLLGPGQVKKMMMIYYAARSVRVEKL